MQMIETFKTLLQTIPDNIIPPENIGVPRPVSTADLPAISLSVEQMSETVIGIGSIIETIRISEDQLRETSGRRKKALINIEIWSRTDEQTGNIANAVEQLLATSKVSLRLNGFVDLSLHDILPQEQKTLGSFFVPTSVRAFLRYHVNFEEIVNNDIGPGGIINEVQVVFKDDSDLPMAIN